MDDMFDMMRSRYNSLLGRKYLRKKHLRRGIVAMQALKFQEEQSKCGNGMPPLKLRFRVDENFRLVIEDLNEEEDSTSKSDPDVDITGIQSPSLTIDDSDNETNNSEANEPNPVSSEDIQTSSNSFQQIQAQIHAPSPNNQAPFTPIAITDLGIPLADTESITELPEEQPLELQQQAEIQQRNQALRNFGARPLIRFFRMCCSFTLQTVSNMFAGLFKLRYMHN
ncbi:hypothetical protein Ciccas_005384 [Cichlidogyrus casuarinus]|uniref:Uncharacterized protein n=1 Tax=Cichlidogyrus casuarinus TaxID=1844966 RepID=A0ABD2Q8S9_9PLAT